MKHFLGLSTDITENNLSPLQRRVTTNCVKNPKNKFSQKSIKWKLCCSMGTEITRLVVTIHIAYMPNKPLGSIRKWGICCLDECLLVSQEITLFHWVIQLRYPGTNPGVARPETYTIFGALFK